MRCIRKSISPQRHREKQENFLCASVVNLFVFQALQQISQRLDDLAPLHFWLTEREIEAVRQRLVLELKRVILWTACFFWLALLAELLARQIAGSETPQRLLHRLLASRARDLHQN